MVKHELRNKRSKKPGRIADLLASSNVGKKAPAKNMFSKSRVKDRFDSTRASKLKRFGFKSAAKVWPGKARNLSGVQAVKPVPVAIKEEKDDDDDEEATDDEDSDDDEREQLEERLLQEDESDPTRHLPERANSPAPHLSTTAPPCKYCIAIPTHGRWRPVRDMTGKVRFQKNNEPFILAHTLGFLSREGIPNNLVTLFIATKEESQNYRRALKGSEWANIRIVLSALGNRNNRNFIFTYFPEGTYVVSIDDDIEKISWKFREGITHHSLRSLPQGSFEKLIFDARQRMSFKGAHLWGLNTSQNPRHMSTYGVSVKNGLVNGYMNGFLCRPKCTELLRVLADAMEDSEFAVRHYVKDGVVLRYRMYAGITSPYLNRGGLQEKFEASGEKITAAERSDARKAEERWGAMELHYLFPRLVGPPRARRDKKTMEVVFYPNGYPIGEGSQRRMIAPRLRDDDRIVYGPNPKVAGSVSWKLYENYKVATTVAEARNRGARGIDFAFDSNWGYLKVTCLSTVPMNDECKLKADEITLEPKHKTEVAIATGSTPFMNIRVKEMSKGHKGMSLLRRHIAQLAKRCPNLCQVPEADWTDMEGPLASMPLEILRVLLHWAKRGELVYSWKQTQTLHANLKILGAIGAARSVKRLETRELRVQAQTAKAGSSKPMPFQKKSLKMKPLAKAKKPACSKAATPVAKSKQDENVRSPNVTQKSLSRPLLRGQAKPLPLPNKSKRAVSCKSAVKGSNSTVPSRTSTSRRWISLRGRRRAVLVKGVRISDVKGTVPSRGQIVEKGKGRSARVFRLRTAKTGIKVKRPTSFGRAGKTSRKKTKPLMKKSR